MPLVIEHRQNDLLARNVLVEGDRISGVLDWGSACFGDPLYDAAWLLYCWGWYPQWSSVDIEAAIGRHARLIREGGLTPAIARRV